MLERTNGSHEIYRHLTFTDKRVVQPRGKNAKPYQVAQFLDMIDKLGLTLKD